jgi:cellulose synthase operon protein YhjU
MLNFLKKVHKKLECDLRLIGLWNFYFLFKFYLFIKGSIRLDIVLNLLFLFFVAAPLPEAISKRRGFRLGRNILNVVLALFLLWHDSWLPPVLDAASFLNQQGMPSFAYIISFTRGYFSMSLFIALIAALMLAVLTYKWARKYKMAAVGSLAVLIIAVPVIPKNFGKHHQQSAEIRLQTSEAAEIKDPAKYLESFYSTESERVIMFKQPGPASPAFDIVALHVCSFSWDDMKEIGMAQDDPFFKQFDYFFTNFNTATGYSGPAVLRLLQANCGQRSHNDIHKGDAQKACLLFESLSSVGYEPYISMSHDGKYGDFTKAVKKNVPKNSIFLAPDDLKPEAIFFDGKSPLYGDYAALKKWFDSRQASKSERAALYYNSVLLHAGSHWVGEKKWHLRDKHDQFKDVSSVLLKDVKKFIELLKSSKRNTVLIFLPEHGRALTGSSFQAADLRDIPLPKITKVPVGVKLIGPKFNDKKVQQHIISKPSSYFALSWLLSKFIENSPFGSSAASPEDIAFKIPKTDFVSEHEGRVIIETGGSYLYHGKDRKWITLSPDQLK